MATLISKQTGNLTASTTWYLGDATSFLDSQASNTNLTTSYVASSAFTPGAITVDGIAVKVANRAGTTGTFSVELYNSTAGASVSGTEVTIDVDDVNAGDTAANNGCGWFYMKFGSPVLLLAATNYQVRAKASNTSQIALFRDATAGNWSRVLVTTTEQAPAATDVLIITASYTAANTRSDYTVTMNETATTDYGQIYVCQGGTLTAATSASTNYNLKTSGVLRIWGTVNFGTSGTRMPDSSTLTVTFDCTSSVEFGVEVQNGGELNVYGSIKTPHVKLDADASAGATTVTLNQTPTNWDNGDTLVFASTTRTRGETEIKALTADVTTTSASISALTNAHGGNSTTFVQAEVSNLTRNVKIYGVSVSLPTYILTRAGSTVYLNHVECRYIGSNTGNKRGIDVQSTSQGVFSAVGITVYDSTVTSSQAIYVSGNTADTITIQDCTIYNFISTGVTFPATSGTSYTIDNNIAYLCGTGFSFSDNSGVITNNTSVGASSSGIVFADSVSGTGTVSGNVAHSGSSTGILISSAFGVCSFPNMSSWRNSSTGMNLISTSNTASGLVVTVDNFLAFGNSGTNLNFPSTIAGEITISNSSIYGGTTLVAATGIQLSSTVSVVRFIDCEIGVTSAHSSRDVLCSSNVIPYVIFYNTQFGSTTEIATQSALADNIDYLGIVSMNHDGAAGDHRRYLSKGNIIRDTTTLSSVSLSERMTPSSASVKIISSIKKVAVNNGQAVTIDVKVRKSVVGDGTAYNGNQPRLILRRNSILGITTDTVIDTATASADGAYETLTGTTSAATDDGVFEFYVDCDGTTGWVNLYDWGANINNDPSSTEYWSDGAAYLGAEYNAGGGGGQRSYVFG